MKELQALFQQEGERNHVFPLIPTLSQQPSSFNGRKVFVFRDGVERLPNRVGPQLVGRPHQITADVQVPATGGDGVIIAQGSRYGGFTLYVKDHHVIYEVNAYGKRAGRIVSTAPLAPGAAHIELQVIPEAPKANSGALTILGPRGIRAGKVLLTVNDLQREADFANVLGASPTETLDIGSDLGSAVSKDYISPNRYTGSIQTVTVELK